MFVQKIRITFFFDGVPGLQQSPQKSNSNAIKKATDLEISFFGLG